MEVKDVHKSEKNYIGTILDFSKFDFWPMGLVRRLIFLLDTKFGAKMLIDAEIMAKNLNSR